MLKIDNATATTVALLQWRMDVRWTWPKLLYFFVAENLMHRSLSLLLSSVAAIRWLVYLSCHLWDAVAVVVVHQEGVAAEQKDILNDNNKKKSYEYYSSRAIK